jgi:hypothetical protein
LSDDGLDIRKVGSAGIALWGADGDEDSLALLDGGGQVGRELNGVSAVAGKQLGPVIFKVGDAALAQELDLGLVVVDGKDAMAHFGEANGSYKSNVSGPDDADGNWLGHQLSCLLRFFSPELAR